jgi:DHA1 family inner membrane transport protein
MNEPTPRNLTAVVVILTAGMLFMMTTIGLTSALLVDLANEFDTTVAITGQLLTIQAIVWGLASPVVGPISDRIGRKKILVTGLVVAGASMLLYHFAWEYYILNFASVLAGLGGSLTGPSILSIVGDHFPRNKLGRIMALVGAAVPLSYIIGAPGGAWIADNLGWRASFFTLGLLLLLTAFLCFFILPSQKVHQSTGEFAYLSSFKKAFKQKAFLILLIANVMAGSSYSTIYSYLAAFLIQNYSLSLGQVAPLILYIAIGQLLGNFLGGAMADRFDRYNICAVTQFLTGLTAIALTLITGNIWLSVFLGAIFSGLFNTNRPVFASINASLSSSLRGTIMGMMALSNQLGRATGTMVGGLVLGLAGYKYMGAVSFLFSLVGAILFFYSRPGSPQLFQEYDADSQD